MKLSWKKSNNSSISLYERHLELENNGHQFRIPLEQIEKIHSPTNNPMFRYFSYLKLDLDQHSFKGFKHYLGEKAKEASKRSVKLSVKNPPEEVLDFIESMKDNRARCGSERILEEGQVNSF